VARTAVTGPGDGETCSHDCLGASAFGAALAVAATVLFTAAAGVLFCELRRRSGSLLAPMGLHWAVNAFGYVAGFLLR
jgi:membrane protease YdiL (CAAX protease family)